MQNLFNPHPYSTQVGILTERATDSGQNSDDWSLILEICDTINETDEGPKEAVRAIRKRINSSAGKDHVAIWRTLVLLEACVKNCGRRLHSQIANKEFLHDFLKLLSPKNEPSQQMQAKVLSMIKLWVDSRWDVPGKRDLEKIYTSLRQRGIQFPSHPIANEVFQRRTNSIETIDVRPVSSLPHSSKSHICHRDSRKQFNVIAPTTNVHRPIPELHPDPNCASNTAPLCHTCRTHHPPASNPPVAPTPESFQSHLGSVIVVRNATVPAHASQPVQLTHPPAVHTRVNGSIGMDQPISVNHRSDSYARQRRTSCCAAHTPVDRMEFDLDGTVRHLTSSQRVRLAQDLSVVETNVNVLNDMLAELRPDCVSPEDVNLLQELYQTCRAMHRRVVLFLSQVADEEATPCLLQVNDNLTSAFSRYERFERYRMRALRSEMMHETAALDLASARFGSFHGHPVRDSRLAIENYHRNHHLHNNNTSSPAPMLAITAGRTGTDRQQDDLRRSTGCSNRGLANGQREHNPRCEQGGDGEDEDDDDDSLIDIGGASPRARDCTTTDVIDRWLNDRQLVPVTTPSVTQNCHHHQQHNHHQGNGSATCGPHADRLALEQATGALNALALVPTSQSSSSSSQIRPTPAQPPSAMHKRSGPVVESTRRQTTMKSEDLVQF